MSLQFVLGNSGSGKTDTIFRKILTEAKENPNKNYLIMAPEQSTMVLQRKLVDLSESHVIMNVDVLGFTRLAYRIFDELGMTNLTVLEETGKNLVLRKVAQEKEEELTVLRPNLSRMGYIGEVKSVLSEFAQYHVTAQVLEEFIGQGRSGQVLSAKLKDILVMQKGFEAFLEEKYITQEELLTVFCKVASKSEILKNSVIVFDDYTGFTPVQKDVLRVLLPLVEKIYVIMTMDEREVYVKSRGIQDLFDMPKKAMDSLYEMCQNLDVDIEKPLVLSGGDEKRFQEAKDLYFLEQNLFRNTYRVSKEKPKHIHLTCGKNPREELILCAREIHRLVKEEGYHYGDMAVVSGNPEVYCHYAEEVFEKYRIPFFLDQTTEIVFHPFVEFLRAVLELLWKNFTYQSMLRLLRTGFIDLKTDEIDILENYVLALGIKGYQQWNKDFYRLPRQNKNLDLEKVNEIRSKIMSLLVPLKEAFDGSKHTLRQQVTALYEFVVACNCQQKLWQKQRELEEKNDLAKAKEYQQIYGIVMGLFDKMVGVLGEEVLPLEEFIEILEAGLSAAKVSSLPPSRDTITMGDIERTRLNAVKILFFLGVNDGIIPGSQNRGGILSEYERSILADARIELANNAREQVFIQKYYLYLNLTKPSRHLYLSYSMLDTEGKAQSPSYLVGTIGKMFPALETEVHSDAEKEWNLATKEGAFDYFVHGEKNENWYVLANVLLQDDLYKERVQELIQAGYVSYEHEPISKVVSEALYGRKIQGSVTRLEQYARCAYSQFLTYGLGLQRREESGFAPVDVGNLYHNALLLYSERLEASEYDWHHVPDSVRDEMAEQAMEDAAMSHPLFGEEATAEMHHTIDQMKRVMKQTVWALTEQVKKGEYVPQKFEVRFTSEMASNLILNGRIDRLDLCENPEEVSLKVIDYKSGNTTYDIVKIYEGLQLQLVLYFNAAKELVAKEIGKKELIPGGLFYYRIADPLLDADTTESKEAYEKALLRALKPDGVVNQEENEFLKMDTNLEDDSDVIPIAIKKDKTLAAKSSCLTTEQFELLGDYVTNLVKKQTEEIYEGNIRVNPYQDGQRASCDYCDFKSVCGFDARIPGFEKRTLKKRSKEEVLELMETELAKRGTS